MPSLAILSRVPCPPSFMRHAPFPTCSHPVNFRALSYSSAEGDPEDREPSPLLLLLSSTSFIMHAVEAPSSQTFPEDLILLLQQLCSPPGLFPQPCPPHFPHVAGQQMLLSSLNIPVSQKDIETSSLPSFFLLLLSSLS